MTDPTNREERAQSSSDRSIRRRPFLGTVGAFGLGAGLAGRVGADDDEWPSPSDPYYAGLVSDLSEMGLPPAEFVHGESEIDVRGQYWADADEYGSTDDIDVSDDVPFSQATRFEVTEEPGENWDVQIRIAEWASDPYRSVDAGDVMLGVAYLRAPEGDATAQYVIDNSQSDDWNDVVSDDQQEPPSEWQRYFFPIEFGAAADGSEYEWSSQLHLGFDIQTVDVGGLALLDFGQEIDVSDLPSGAVGDDHDGDEDENGEEYDSWPEVDDEYYAGLVDELSELDIAPGQFVYAENEPDTFATYELAGDNDDLSEQEALDIDDDVPFAEATRISVGELEDGSLDPWGVNFQATVDDRAVSAGDTLLGVVYLRNPGTGGSTADVTYKTTDEDNEAENYVLNGGVAAGQEWERYLFPINFQTSGDAGEWWTEFWVGIEGQTVDIGGLALLDFAQGVDANELPSWDDEIDLEDGWEEEADARIQDHRTADLTISVADADGDAVDADVALEMQDHEFAFGTAVDAPRLQEDDADAEQYREHIPELFNTTVLENQHKWRFFEDNQDLADDATDWILEQDLDIRGHACLWSSRDSNSIPEDVEDAMDEGDAAYVAERSLEHIETVIEHYGDDMEHWDVVNEAVHETEMTELIDGEDVDPVEAPILEEWYETATDVAPEGVAIDVNDYNVLAGPYEGTRDDYERQIEFLTAADGVDLGGIGLQSHFSRGEQLTPGEIMDALDRYAEAGDGAALRITEFDMADPNWLEEDKADFFHWFLKTVFSHPDMEDFLMWGFWDDEHWQDDAPLFDEEWNPKPTYDVYTDLVFEEWWTDETGETDADGAFDVTAFLGEYDLTVDLGDGEVGTSLSLEEATEQSVEITLVDIDVRGSGQGNGRVPVHINAGEAFDPADVDYDTVRFGNPDVVAAGGGSDVVHLPGGNGNANGSGSGNGRGNGNGRASRSQMVHFDGGDSNLEDSALLTGQTEDGDLIVGFAQL